MPLCQSFYMADTNSPSDSFNNAAATQWSWIDEYHGLEGYKRMRSEVMESLLAEYPELRGKMEIFDLTAPDKEAEQRRIEKSLGLPEGAVTEPVSGMARPFSTTGKDHIFDDNTRMVIGNVEPDNNDWEALKPEDIKYMAWHLTHELFHGIDFLKKGSTLYDDLAEHDVPNSTTSKWSESLADAGRLSMFKRNMGDRPGELGDLKGFIINNNFNHGLNGKLYTEEPSANSSGTKREVPLIERIPLSENPKYDNGEFIARIDADTPIERKANSYRMEGWQRAFEQVAAARDQWKMLSNDNASVQLASTILMSDLARQAKAEAVQNLQPHGDYLKQVYSATPEDAVNDLFLNGEKVRETENGNTATNKEVRDIITASQEKFIGTLREKRDIYPGAARMIASYEARLDPQKPLPLEEEKAPLSTELTARAYSLYDKTRSPDDLKAAQYYSQVEDVVIPQNMRDTLNNAIATNAELRETLKNTEPADTPTASAPKRPSTHLGM